MIENKSISCIDYLNFSELLFGSLIRGKKIRLPISLSVESSSGFTSFRELLGWPQREGKLEKIELFES